jgi:putative transcriptional regulator
MTMDTKNIERLEVTDENFGALLIQGLQEAVAFERGEITARVRIRSRAAIAPPPTYDAKRIQAVRRGLKLNQRDFASALNVSDKTVKAWEQGVKLPSGATLRLLQVIERQPEVILAAGGTSGASVATVIDPVPAREAMLTR